MQILTLPLLASYPFFPSLKGFMLMLVVNCASFLKNTFSVSANFLSLLFCLEQICTFQIQHCFTLWCLSKSGFQYRNMFFQTIFSWCAQELNREVWCQWLMLHAWHYLCQWSLNVSWTYLNLLPALLVQKLSYVLLNCFQVTTITVFNILMNEAVVSS